MAAENNLSMDSFGIQEKANSKIYTNSTVSMANANINSGSNQFNPGSITRGNLNTGKSKFYKASSPNEEVDEQNIFNRLDDNNQNSNASMVP